MTQQTNGGAQTGTVGRPTGSPPTTQVAREQAAGVGQSTAEAGRQVAGTAADQAGQVVQETRKQAADLLQQARRQATEQARGGQQQAARGLRSLATELHQMADGGDEHGPVSDVAEQAAGRVDAAAGWLERHEPGDLVEEVRRLARRRPGAFLVGAALVGVLAGRLTRGAVDAQRDTGPDRGSNFGPDYGPDSTATAPMPPVALPAEGPPVGYPTPPPMPYEQPGGAALPPRGPVGVPPLHDPGAGLPTPAPRTGPTTVGGYVEELGRDRPIDPRGPR